MLWEEMTSGDFAQSVQKSEGVCLLPIGVLEKHGDHLPLGTDMVIASETVKAAAKKSFATIFPYYFFGQIAEARHVKGTIAPSHRLIMDAILEMCDEIHRNGFTKILIVNGHGGNEHFLPFFAQMLPALNRPYAVYTYFVHVLADEQLAAIQTRAGVTDLGGHAGFAETALMMYLRPKLVHMDRVKVEESVSMNRLKGLNDRGVFTGFNWYASYPHHFAGDPSLATAEHGAFLFGMMRDNVAGLIRKIKADTVSPALIEEFNGLAR